MTLKEEIGNIVFDAMCDAVEAVPRDGEEDGPYPGYGEYVDDILGKVREALLSIKALDAAAVDIWGVPADVHNMSYRAIAAALDAVTGS